MGGAGNVATVVDGGTYSVDATGALALESSGGSISIGTDSANFAISMGSAGRRAVSIGNTEATSSMTLNAGSGDMALTVDGGMYNLDAHNGVAIETKLNGPIYIGDDAGSCTNPTTATTVAACSGTWTYYTG